MQTVQHLAMKGEKWNQYNIVYSYKPYYNLFHFENLLVWRDLWFAVESPCMNPGKQSPAKSLYFVGCILINDRNEIGNGRSLFTKP